MNSKSKRICKDELPVGINKKRRPNDSHCYLIKCLQISGLLIKYPPDKSVITEETINVVRNIKKNLHQDLAYPDNVGELIQDFQKISETLENFKSLLYPNIIREDEETECPRVINDSVIKILLNVTDLQEKLLNVIFEKAIDFATEGSLSQWIQMILRCITTLDSITNAYQVVSNMINLMDLSSEVSVRLEIISALPDIIGDQENEKVPVELSRFLAEDKILIPAILDCLSFLYLSESQFADLHKKSLNILQTSPPYSYFHNFIKFLSIPGRLDESAYIETINGLRNSLDWSDCQATFEEVASSQTLTAVALRNSMISSKIITSSWFKAISSCKVTSDFKPIDLIISLIMYSISEDKQKQIENFYKKIIKLNIMRRKILDEVFRKFKPILRNYLQDMLKLTNYLLKQNSYEFHAIAIHWYLVMFAELDDSRQTILVDLMQIGLNSKTCTMSMLSALNDMASKNLSLLKPQSLQMLILLDKTGDMLLDEIREVMKVVCALAYKVENSILRDDVHMIIRKQLSSSDPSIKIRGILAAVQAVKYLMADETNESTTAEIPEDISYSAYSHLSEGPSKDAAQLIELISRSTKQFPNLIGFFYDELAEVITLTNHINSQFIAWLTDAVTNDLQQHFIVDNIVEEKISGLTLAMEYCLNSEEELDDMIALNIAGLVMDPCKHDNVNIMILPSLFQLIQTTHSKQHNGDLSNIDALLGCPIVMPKFDPELFEDLDDKQVFHILDCIVHCINWFRELVNAFSNQSDSSLKDKVLKRVDAINDLECLLSTILSNRNVLYKPPACTFNIKKYTNETNLKITVTKATAKTSKKQINNNESVLPETGKLQATQTQASKSDAQLGIHLRQVNLDVLNLINDDNGLKIKTLNFILKIVYKNVSSVMVSKIVNTTFFKNSSVYDPERASHCAQKLHDYLPKLVCQLDHIDKYMREQNFHDRTLTDEAVLTTEVIDYELGLEYVFNIFKSYFGWIGFKNGNIALLKSSLRAICAMPDTDITTLNELLINVAKYFQKHQDLCMQLSTAVALVELTFSLYKLSENNTIANIVQDMTSNFLSRLWCTLEGVAEKGLVYNQGVDKLMSAYFIKPDLRKLKSTTIQIKDDMQNLKSRSDTLSSMKSISRSNFTLLYRNLIAALYDGAKVQVNGKLTDNEHLDLWKDVAFIMKTLTEMAKTLDNRNNLATFLKKSQPIFKLFLSHGIPIIEIKLKSETDLVIEILRLLQQSTRFLQTLCCHSRLKKDTSLMSKVPQIRLLLETLIYKVKAALAANKCSEAFWMGNLKNKNIHGEVIQSQQSEEDDEAAEDADDQLPEDDSGDESDDQLNPDSKSISDIV